MKAIETVYNGYRFRSRLEARWAVFFDTLGIRYEYEKEGFDLDGTRYLPDFWLPELKYWIEIKGQFPSCEEMSKAFWLAWHTENKVFLCAGNIGPQGIDPLSGIIGLGNIAFSVKGTEGMREGELSTFKRVCSESSFNPLANGIRCLDLVQADIAQWLKTGQSEDFEAQVFLRRAELAWTECLLCHQFAIEYHGFFTRMKCHCVETDGWKEGDKDYHNMDSPRLIEAYTAARQARFEHGETPFFQFIKGERVLSPLLGKGTVLVNAGKEAEFVRVQFDGKPQPSKLMIEFAKLQKLT